MKTPNESKMASERKNAGKAIPQKHEKNDPEFRKQDTTVIRLKKKLVETTKENLFELQKQNDEKEATITALRIEIDNLKKKVADQEETIDDLVEDRDEGWDEVYRLKLKLEEA